MRKFLATLALAATLTSCSTSMISVDAIRDPIMLVSDRHDAYVEADPDLSDSEKDIFLRTTELLRKILEEASK